MKKMPIFWILFLSIFYIVGFLILGSGAKSLIQALEAKKWPIAIATLQDVRMEHIRDSDGATHHVKVKYQYQVEGIVHTGNNLAYGYNASSGRIAHSEIYDKLKNAKQVEVRFNPIEPSQSTLTYGATRSHFIMIAFGTTWLLFIIGFTVLVCLYEQNDANLLRRLVVIK